MLYDVLIIGAGVTGTLTAAKLSALRLADRPLQIAVAEAGEDVASGTSKANSGIAHAGYDAESGTQKARLNVAGAAQLPELCARFGVDYEKCGSLVVGFDEEERKTLLALQERGRRNGVARLSLVEGSALFEMEPQLSPDATVALYAPDAAVISPYGLAIGAAQNAEINGVHFLFGFRADRVTVQDGVFSVYSGCNVCKARYVINAAGVHCDTVARLFGEEDFPLRIIPRRGEYMILDKSCDGLVRHTLFPCPTAHGKGILVSPTADRNIIVGPNANEIDDPDDTATTKRGLDEVLQGARRLIPSIPARSMITSFSGVRATPSTGDFYLAPSQKYPHLIHAAGIESPGIASSPAIADTLVSLLEEAGLSLLPREDYNPYARADGTVPKLFRACSDEEKAQRIAQNPAYGRVVCRCETITEGDILDAIHAPVGARSLDMVKRRVRAGMGRCQGGFCSGRVAELLARETGMSLDEITKCGDGSRLLFGVTK